MIDNHYPKHGLSKHNYRETYDRLFTEQNGRCAVCNHRIGDFWRWESKITQLVIDHSHTTGKIRSLLCSQCNTHVGNVENGNQERVRKMGQPIPDYLAKVTAYLEKFQ